MVSFFSFPSSLLLLHLLLFIDLHCIFFFSPFPLLFIFDLMQVSNNAVPTIQKKSPQKLVS